MEKQKAKRKAKRIWPLQGDACFHGDVGACACMYNDLTHACPPHQPLVLPVCRQSVCLHAAHGAVTCQAAVCTSTLCSKREESTIRSQQLKFIITIL